MRLSQVFLNLLNNAAKYTEPGGKISLTANLQETNVVVRVTDTGLGIPSEELPQLFELFTRLERDTGQEGLGIGLNLVKQLVDMHGGSSEAHSAGLGQGSEFVVRLPTVKSDSGTNKAEENPQKSQGPKTNRNSQTNQNPETRSRRVLLVDDYKPNLRTLSRILSLMGHEVARQIRSRAAYKDVKLVALTGYVRARRRYSKRTRCRL